MGKHGAKYIILSSRSGRNQANTMEVVEELATLGVKVEVYQSNIAIVEDLQRLISDCAKHMPPIGGVIHGAYVNKASRCKSPSKEKRRLTIIHRTFLSSWPHIKTGSMSYNPNTKVLGTCTMPF